jgi:probable H4MPT-linked C1 transfer pathway protein
MSWVALDIGGANIKVADGLGFARSLEFPLWKNADRLRAELLRALSYTPSDHVAITMTGELADCFDSKSHGVRYIMDEVVSAAGARLTRVYLTDGSFVTADVAVRNPQLAASSNWHALARFCGRFAPQGRALLIDIGSTTTDIIGLVDGDPTSLGQTDTERMLAGELVYTGVERSPICSLLQSTTYRGRRCRVAQELFATTRDAYLVLGECPEDVRDKATADGRPATVENAQRRLGRMLCADLDQFSREDAETLARDVVRAQLDMLIQGALEVLAQSDQRIETVILSGHGGSLAHRLVDRLVLDANVVALSSYLDPDVSRCAPAHALAVLARETLEC